MNSIVYLIILASPLFSDGICHVYYDNGNFMLRKFLFVNDNIIVSDVCRIFNQQKIKKGNYTMLSKSFIGQNGWFAIWIKVI